MAAKLLSLMLITSACFAESSQQCRQVFTEVANGSLCIGSEFTRTLSGIASDLQCSLQCGTEPRCQAFTTTDGPCQLFVFDKCSKSVRDCSCSSRGRLFVKRQPGLKPGALCPSGYGDDLCGVKYKIFKETNTWDAQKLRCESDAGLVIMADVTGNTEMSHIDALATSYGLSFHLGGFQAPGSSEPDGGWHWVACDIPISATSSLWNSGEPNNALNRENVITRGHNGQMLSDGQDTDSGRSGLCECVSPFE